MLDANRTQGAARTVPPFQRLAASLDSALRPVSESVSSASARFANWYAEHEDAIVQTLQNLTFIGIAASRPENWRDLQASDLLRLSRVAIEDQLCLVWVPRTETVRELLLQSDREQRQLVLVARRAEILDDCEVVLSTTSDPQDVAHAGASELALKAIAAARDGHVEAAQALAGAVLGSVIHEILGFEKQAEARRTLGGQAGEEDLRLFMLRETVLYGATARVLARTSEGLTGFNRHATAHGQLGSFECAEMLEAVMLITAWLREITFQQKRAMPQSHPSTPGKRASNARKSAAEAADYRPRESRGVLQTAAIKPGS